MQNGNADKTDSNRLGGSKRIKTAACFITMLTNIETSPERRLLSRPRPEQTAANTFRPPLPQSSSLPHLSSLNQHGSPATRPASSLTPGSDKVLSRWPVSVTGKAVHCRFEARGSLGWARPDGEAAACVLAAASDRRGAKSGNMVCTFPFDTN